MSDRLRGPDDAPPRVLVAGGGVAALDFVLALRALAGARVAIELIAPERDLRYPPLDVVEPFGLSPPHVELAEALASQGATHRLDALADVDAVGHRIRTRDGAVLHYEALVVAVGDGASRLRSVACSCSPGRRGASASGSCCEPSRRGA